MSDVLTVPGVETVHPRSSWTEGGYPITGPAADWNIIREGVAHYTADDDLIDGDPGEHASQLPQYLRNIQRAYVNGRGYSIGYWWAVDWLGGAWQMRGWELRSAANAGRKITPGVNDNIYTGPVLYLVDGADRLTAEAARTGRALYREMGRRVGRKVYPFPHSHYDFTSCPGDGIRLDIAEGLLDPDNPIDHPTTTEETMFIVKHSDGTFHLGNGMTRTYTAVPTVIIAAYVRTGQPLKDWRTGRDVRVLDDVTTGNAKELGLDPSEIGPQTLKAAK